MASISNSFHFSLKRSNFYSSSSHKLINRNLTNSVSLKNLSIIANSKNFESIKPKCSQLLKPRNSVDVFVTKAVAADAEGHDIEITDGFVLFCFVNFIYLYFHYIFFWLINYQFCM